VAKRGMTLTAFGSDEWLELLLAVLCLAPLSVFCCLIYVLLIGERWRRHD
jgi:hypothetical protein